MSGKIPALPPVAVQPVNVTPKPSSPATSPATPHPPEHRHVAALSPAYITYVVGSMGLAPPQTMEYIMLKTGVPMPANLGQDIDTSV